MGQGIVLPSIGMPVVDDNETGIAVAQSSSGPRFLCSHREVTHKLCFVVVECVCWRCPLLRCRLDRDLAHPEAIAVAHQRQVTAMERE
jgi:hypothetical protein